MSTTASPDPEATAFRQVTVQAPNGFDSSRCFVLAKDARAFQSDIYITYLGRQCSAKSLSKLRSLGIIHDSTVILEAEGQDAHTAVDRLVVLIEGMQ